MLLGIGVDIVHLPRIAAVVKRQTGSRLARRILCTKELDQWNRLNDKDVQQRIRFLGVRWAVKEAAYKALYPAIKPTWKEFSYEGLSTSGKKPTLTFVPFIKNATQQLGAIHVSVSHDGEYVIAYVTVEQGTTDSCW